jgi:cobalt/nickel transport system permease protein
MRWIEQHTYNNRIRKLHPAYKAAITFLVLLVCLLTTDYFISFFCFWGIFVLTVIWARIPISVFLKLILSEGSFLVIAILGVAVSVTFNPSIGAIRVGSLWFSITAASANLALVIFFRALVLLRL